MDIDKVVKETKPLTLLYALLVLAESLLVKFKVLNPMQLVIVFPDQWKEVS